MMLDTKKTVGICETQPLTAEGLRSIIGSCEDLQFTQHVESLAQASELMRGDAPDILIVDKAFGIQAVMDWLLDLRTRHLTTAAVIWGVSLTEAEALRFIQVGARGIIRKSANAAVLLSCLHTVAAGQSWMEDTVFKDALRHERYPRSELTMREQQVLELVEQGFKNREIASDLGIRPGTVKIHLKHIFEKTGVRGRYGLALSGLKDRGLLSLTA